jgi:hypothetical protein
MCPPDAVPLEVFADADDRRTRYAGASLKINRERTVLTAYR